MDKSYIKGVGVKQDKQKAVQLYTKVSDSGDMEICKLVKMIKKLESKE